MATQNAVNNGLSGSTGTANFVGSTSPNITTPRVITAINDTNGNELLKVTATASAVNEITIANQATGNSPSFGATGDDANITLVLNGKGTSGAALQGKTNAGNVAAGYLSEFLSSVIAAASGVVLADNVAANVTSISLTAGDWDVWGNVAFVSNTGTSSYAEGWISTTSATSPDASLFSQVIPLATSNTGMCVPSIRINVSGAQTVYLSVVAGVSVALKACGGIYARRV